MIRGIFNRLTRFLEEREQKRIAKRGIEVANGSLSPREFAKKVWNSVGGRSFSPPVLTGARLLRTSEACDPRHLLCPPKYPNMFSDSAKLLRHVQRMREGIV